MAAKSNLKSFLHANKTTKSREFLLTSRVIHDLMVAAAARNYDLLVYTPTVDSDGFDLILDDRDRYLPLQLKSVTGKKREWDIHRKLLRPERHEVEWFGFESSACGTGRGGGVLLLEVSSQECTVDVKYLYTDIHVLTAFWLDLISITTNTKKRLFKLREELESTPGGIVYVPKSAFLQARTPEHLLALAGLHSRYRNSWQDLLVQLAQYKYEKRQLNAPEKTIRNLIQKDLKALVIHK